MQFLKNKKQKQNNKNKTNQTKQQQHFYYSNDVHCIIDSRNPKRL